MPSQFILSKFWIDLMTQNKYNLHPYLYVSAMLNFFQAKKKLASGNQQCVPCGHGHCFTRSHNQGGSSVRSSIHCIWTLWHGSHMLYILAEIHSTNRNEFVGHDPLVCSHVCCQMFYLKVLHGLVRVLVVCSHNHGHIHEKRPQAADMLSKESYPQMVL